MKTAISFLPILLVAALISGCGGGGSSSKLGGSDVAVVGSHHITKTDFDSLLVQAKQSFAKQTPPRAFPKQGTAEYETVKGQAVTLLVQQAEREQKAASEGIKITDKQIDARLVQIKKQYFSCTDPKAKDKVKCGETKYKDQLKSQHLTDAQVRDDVRTQLISEAVFNKVTKGVKISDAEVHNYYVGHPQNYSRAQTRDVRHILVKTKGSADSIYAKLKAGNTQTWCTLAKKFSQDPSSKDACGKLTVSKGQTVPEFDSVAFSQKTNVVHAPVHNAQYGWFVIEPLSSVHPRATTPEKQVAATIRTQLVQQKKNQAMTDWVSALSKDFCSGSKIKYQVGYKPTPDPCAAATTTNATTT